MDLSCDMNNPVPQWLDHDSGQPSLGDSLGPGTSPGRLLLPSWLLSPDEGLGAMLHGAPSLKSFNVPSPDECVSPQSLTPVSVSAPAMSSVFSVDNICLSPTVLCSNSNSTQLPNMRLAGPQEQAAEASELSPERSTPMQNRCKAKEKGPKSKKSEPPSKRARSRTKKGLAEMGEIAESSIHGPASAPVPAASDDPTTGSYGGESSPRLRTSGAPKKLSRLSPRGKTRTGNAEQVRPSRASHNQVEKKYRNRLNGYFERLLAVLPWQQLDDSVGVGDCSVEPRALSKIEVLDLARRRIRALEMENAALRQKLERFMADVMQAQDLAGLSPAMMALKREGAWPASL